MSDRRLELDGAGELIVKQAVDACPPVRSTDTLGRNSGDRFRADRKCAVCGRPADSRLKHDFQDETYYFDTELCMIAFGIEFEKLIIEEIQNEQMPNLRNARTGSRRRNES